MDYYQSFGDYLFLYKEEIKLHVFGPGVEHWIVRQSNSAQVITEDYRDSGVDMQFCRQSLNPDNS